MIGVLLAGGRAIRLGGDKACKVIGDATLIEHVARRLVRQCDAIVINANGDPARFASVGYPIVADDPIESRGPLAGVLAGLDYVAANYPQARFAVTVPTDTPFLPNNLVAKLADMQRLAGSLIVCARSQSREHRLTALWSLSLRDDLRHALQKENLSKVSAFIGRHSVAHVGWPVVPYDPFLNVNTDEDLAEARRIYDRSIRSARA